MTRISPNESQKQELIQKCWPHAIEHRKLYYVRMYVARTLSMSPILLPVEVFELGTAFIRLGAGHFP